MSYTVAVVGAAKRELKNLPLAAQQQIAAVLRAMQQDPFALDCKKLKGGLGYRVRTGDYRIVFTFVESTLTIIAIRHRKDAY